MGGADSSLNLNKLGGAMKQDELGGAKMSREEMGGARRRQDKVETLFVSCRFPLNVFGERCR